jgi:cytochrome b pre-mRNA-processing protein 3
LHPGGVMPNPGMVENQACAEPTSRAAPRGSLMRFPFGRSRPAPIEAAADRLHDALVAQIRQPVFYLGFDVPDTFEGRFDLLVLHAGLVLRRLRELGPEGQHLAQTLVDLMFTRFDVAMRELGVSDVAVPKRMKRLAEAFKGRTAAYDDAFARRDPAALAAAVTRNVLAGQANGGPLARYAAATADALVATGVAAFKDGVLPFPDPAQFRETVT